MKAVVTYRPIGFINTPFKDIADMPIQPASARGVAGRVTIDGTPLLDIKPYVPLFDTVTDVRTGWLTDRAESVFDARSDGRFRE
ncbi:MAG: hypothetical protein ABIK91_07495 [Pseudomonadota bacterium]